jgi:uncharacterized SAM-binding protein YcdF (DUF218 family)
VPPKVVATALALPPFLLLLIMFAGLLMRGRRLGRLMAWLGALGLLVLSLPVVPAVLMIALEQDLPLTPPAAAPPQAIVILGGDLNWSGGDTVAAHPGPLSLERERAGAALSRRTGLPVLISGGPIRQGEPAIATLMADSLQQNFQLQARWVESASPDTWQNARMSAAILRQQGIGSVYVVTQAWHERRAIMAFAAAGITATAAPTWLDGWPMPLARGFVPDAQAWMSSYYAFHEWIGCAWYALRRRVARTDVPSYTGGRTR